MLNMLPGDGVTKKPEETFSSGFFVLSWESAQARDALPDALFEFLLRHPGVPGGAP